ncbi:MAG: TIGR04053 family radical SAM/SPASM domain-containing protein [Chloroflexi bacterium]|nr:TIGR04053 family radical SAM/SPASM domain-containing protein [Chloroflexota bacterium]
MASYETRYSQAPLMIYWEVTRACDLACRHCRAEAVPRRHPDELTTEEGFRLLEALAAFGRDGNTIPHLVFTGGDPLQRPDIYVLAERAVELGIPVAVTPSATPLLDQTALEALYAAGVRSLALSLDGSNPRRHDRIRGVAGSFARTIAAARWARAAGFSLQINTLVCAETAADLADIYGRVAGLDAGRWSVFFLVAVGRGAVLRPVDAYECEAILNWLYDVTLESARPAIKTTEAHHFRRVALQRQVLEKAKLQRQAPPASGQPGKSGQFRPNGHMPAVTSHVAASHASTGNGRPPSASIQRGFGIRDGAGIMFISHTGEVYPSGFLPLGVGNVKRDDPVRLYREAPLFVQLRDPALLQGKCGLCEYRVICGGSRSRAWAATGDPLEADPLCLYQPAAATTPGN